MMLLVGSEGLLFEEGAVPATFVHMFMIAIHLEASKGMPDD
jgi:hypothetical protein